MTEHDSDSGRMPDDRFSTAALSTVDEPPVDEEPQPKSHGILEFFAIIVVSAVLVWAIQAFVARPYRVPSGSMLETIQLNDYVLSEKVTLYASSPQRGQVVTFLDPADSDTTLIKRVIATGGQTVDLRHGSVYVDGVELDEPYTDGKPSYPLASTLDDQDISYPYTVPDDCLWVMGDNRTNSADSRYFGAVPVSSVTGHACLIYWPPRDFGGL